MILKTALEEVTTSQKEIILNSEYGVPREKLDEIKIEAGFGAIISGIRRAGKTTLLRQLIETENDFRYINFEDVRLHDFEVGDFNKLDNLLSIGKKTTVFFDEIQNIEGWERYVRNLVDRKVKVVITGSNAGMLSRELGTKLTGRHLRATLFPFSYSEYLSFKKRKDSLKNFNDYLMKGGFTDYLRIGNSLILQELFTDILTRDIIVRYNLRNSKAINDLAIYLLSNIGKEFSYHKLRGIVDFGSVNSIISVINYLEDAYLLYTLHQFDYSYKKLLRKPKKIYAIDSGLINANTVSSSNDYGRILENVVFIELKRRAKEIYYFKQENECDFVIEEKRNKFTAIQVSYKLDEDNQTREINGLMDAMNYFNLNIGLILTLDQEDDIDYNDKKIIVLPIRKWLLGEGGFTDN